MAVSLSAAFMNSPAPAADADTVHLRGRPSTAPAKRSIFKSPHIPLLNRIAAEESVDGYLVQCVVKVESDFKAGAVSTAGAAGRMERKPGGARA